jgi:peptide chain release factor subunit 3
MMLQHAMLAKTQGVNKLIVVINKMDDPTVNWSEERYKECSTKLAQFLKGTGYNKNDVFFMPIAAQLGDGIKNRVPKAKCSWYDGPSLRKYFFSKFVNSSLPKYILQLLMPLTL